MTSWPGHVDRGEVPGLVALVSRGGEVHVDSRWALKHLKRKDSIRRDTIFRIASMSKPIVAAAAMILIEECKLRLDEPVNRLLPELSNRKVLKQLESVETTTTDQLTPEQLSVSESSAGFFDSHGWGFGVAVTTRRDAPSRPIGQYG